MASRSSEVNFTKNYTLLYLFLLCLMTDGVAGARLSSLSLNSACSSILSHGTCASMTTHVGSAVAQYGTFRRLGLADHGSLDRSTAWDSLGRHSTVSGTI